MTATDTILAGRELVDAILRLADEKKAEEVTVLDLRGTQAPADWFVVCQGDNANHNRAISGNIQQGLKTEGVPPWHSEGEDQGRWIVLDYADVVVHVMVKDARKLYALEELWEEVIARRTKAQPGDVKRDGAKGKQQLLPKATARKPRRPAVKRKPKE